MVTASRSRARSRSPSAMSPGNRRSVAVPRASPSPSLSCGSWLLCTSTRASSVFTARGASWRSPMGWACRWWVTSASPCHSSAPGVAARASQTVPSSSSARSPVSSLTLISAQPRSRAQVRAAAGDRHHLFMPLATESRIQGEVAADGADAAQHVRDIAGHRDGREQAASELPVANLLAIVGGDLDSPAHWILHAALDLPQIDPALDAADDRLRRGVARAEERIAHARVDLAREVLAAAVGRVDAGRERRRGEVANGPHEDAVAQNLRGARQLALVIEEVRAVAAGDPRA